MLHNQFNTYKSILIYIATGICLLSTISCYTRVEGCLDVFAQNFTPSADDACDECCTNPNLTIEIKHLIDSTLINSNDTIINSFSQAYKILNLEYYLSDFIIENSEDKTLKTENTIDIISNGVTKTILDNVVLVNTSRFNFVVSQIRDFGQFTSLKFLFGLPSELVNAEKIVVSTSHILSDSLRLKNEVMENVFFKMTIVKGIDFKDTLNLSINANKNAIPIQFVNNLQNKIGQNLLIKLSANYKNWLHSTNLNDNKNTIENSILQNSSQVFYVE